MVDTYKSSLSKIIEKEEYENVIACYIESVSDMNLLVAKAKNMYIDKNSSNNTQKSINTSSSYHTKKFPNIHRFFTFE